MAESKAHRVVALVATVLAGFAFSCGVFATGGEVLAAVSFSGSELLGRPTAESATVNIVPGSAVDVYYEYGTAPGTYTAQTSTESAAAGEPHETVIDGLEPDTHYYYRLQYREAGGNWVARPEHSFWTQRASGGEFTFAITSDSHVNILLGSSTTWTQTMTRIAGEVPDFSIDLGDTFAMDNVINVAGAESAYLFQRQFFDLVGHSAAIFLAPGNHEQEEGWHLDDTGNPATSSPVLGTNARKKFYPNPVPDAFYSGNSDPYSYLSGDNLREDYYAWTWGDALFVVIDPYWYTMTKPFVGNTGGGEGSDTGSGDRWDWTLGQAQYEWLKETLEESQAKYKFVFAHHMVGGSDDYVRGGANPAHLVEWGGYNENGTTWGWDTRRAGWGDGPIHQILVENHVSAFFHGHDHQYAYEIRDGVIYQSMPSAGFSGNGFNIYSTGGGYTIQALPSPGHLLVTVGGDESTVDYVATPSGAINYSYAIGANEVPNTHTVTASAPGGGGSIMPDMVVVDDGDPSGVFTVTADTGYHLESLADNASDVTGDVVGDTYAIASVTEDHTLVATFAPDGAPTLNVTSPNGTENWANGETHDVTWTLSSAVSAGEFRAWVVDGAGNWTAALDATPAVAGQTLYEIPWTVAAPEGTDYKLALYYRTNPSVWVWEASDWSDAEFQISGGLP